MPQEQARRGSSVRRESKPRATKQQQQQQQEQQEQQEQEQQKRQQQQQEQQRVRRQRLEKLHQQHQRRQQLQKRQESQNASDDYLLSKEDDNLYEARMRYLKEKRPSQSKAHREPPPALVNYANSGGPRKGQKTILTYNQSTESPTKDLQMLVMVLAREQLRDEILHLSEIINEQNPFEMRNMRLNSFIANTPDLMDHWKVAMLEEGMRIVDGNFDIDELEWVAPGAGSDRKFPMPMDEHTLVSLPADKPEISKSQVATEYIQAQRGHQGHELEDAMQLFQSEMLKSENAATATPEMFERICTCYKPILQKAVEIEYIEKKPETCQAVSNYIEQLKSSIDNVVQESMTQNLVDAVEHGDAFFRILIGKIMDDLHSMHKDRNFEPVRVVVAIRRQD